MTYLDVAYSYGSQPGEAELRAIDSMREVYGILRVRFDSKQRTVTVQFDASRMKQDARSRPRDRRRTRRCASAFRDRW